MRKPHAPNTWHPSPKHTPEPQSLPIQVIYAFYEGTTAKTPIKSFPLLPTERVAVGANTMQVFCLFVRMVEGAHVV